MFATSLKKIYKNFKFMQAYFQEKPLFLLGEIVFQNVPKPWDYSVVVVETAIILRVLAQVFEINWLFVIRDQSLNLGKRLKSVGHWGINNDVGEMRQIGRTK